MSHASIRMIVHVVNGTWRAMDRFATPEQRRRIRHPFDAAATIKIAFTLTEPTAGTGADLRCSVEREGDTYYLSGEKHLITFGTICDYWLLFARARRNARRRRNRRAARRSPRARRDRDRDGRVDGRSRHRSRAFDASNARRFRSPIGSARRARGLAVALGGFLTPSRISVAMSCVGLARRAQELAIDYAAQARNVRQEARAAPSDPLHDRRERDRYRGGAAAGAPCAHGSGRPARRMPRCSRRCRSCRPSRC